MPFYHYSQNNSGGFFSGPQDIIVEADSPEEADGIAVNHGVYFDDNYSIDCSCCGTRWHRAADWNCVPHLEDAVPYVRNPNETVYVLKGRR